MADNLPALPTDGSTDPVTALLMRAATDPSFDADKFKVAVEFLRERETRAGHRAFNEAMANAAGDMQAAPKDASNDYLRSRYATLPGMLSVIKPITSQYGLAFRFGTLPHPDPDWMTVTCILSLGDHEEVTALPGPILSGEGIKGGKTQMNALQAVGGTVTYLSRYLLGMVFSLIQHMPDIARDDDGGDPTQGKRTYTQTPASQPPYQAGTQTGQRQPAQPATAANGGGQPSDPAPWLKRLETLLLGCKTTTDVDAVKNRDAIRAWREGATETVRAQIDAMMRATYQRLAPPESKAPATDPSPTLAAVLETIANADQATLDGLPTNTVFNQAVLALSFPDQDRVDAAIKARAAALGGAA